MNDSQSNRSCPKCRQPLPPDAPGGLCPECLMLEGLETARVTTPRPAAEAPAGRLPAVGEEFGGYRIHGELGRGGMGAVYEAEQLESGRRVALKLLNHQLDSPEARARFLREGRLAASINHPNSVYVYGTEEIEGMPAIAMELVAGGTLEDRVKSGKPFPVGEAVDAVVQVIAGLEAAQAIGILHRDIKPANCFQDADGTVKIGDFGLSISTEARGETHLTLEGTIIGTPAFSSPEQLRGEELNARSDLYSVGVTLYYLLTGRTPFQGKTVAQLFANVLEGDAPSPTEFRPEIPAGLAKAVMRCLEKTPGERFKNYAELRQVLAPFRSEAPVPAPLPLRGLAGIVDWLLVSGLAMVAHLLLTGNLATDHNTASDSRPANIAAMIGSVVAWVLYYAILEGRWGASIGKAICGLRVAGPDRNPPGFLKALLRALVLLILPALPIWIYFGFDPIEMMATGPEPLTLGVRYSYYVILALLFVTVRRRNGFATVHDLLTKTRVIRKAAFHERPALAAAAAEPVSTTEETRKVGPYHVLETIEKGGETEWILGYDSRLLRKAWVRVVPPGTPPVKPMLRRLGRVGRLRWIAGRRSESENWDAFEAPGGESLARLAEKGRQPWSHVRFWLLDIAREIDAAGQDGTSSETLSFDRVWITGDGRAKLLDFPAPGTPGVAGHTKGDSVSGLLGKVAATAKAPLPLHAGAFVDKLSSSSFATPAAVVKELKPLIGKVATVSRARRTALVAGCVAFPLVATLGFLLSMRMVDNWDRQQPDVMALQQVLSLRQMSRWPWMKNEKSIDDRLFAIYIASHFRETITDEAEWTSLYAVSMVSGENRRFAEQSAADHPDPGEKEIREADAAVGPHATGMSMGFARNRWFPLLVGASSILSYVAVPAMIAALLCRGGLVLLVCGVAVARPGGTRASRGRAFWRSLVTWSPLFLAPVFMGLLTPVTGIVWTVVIASAVVLLLVAISLWLPQRGLQDRIAGTCLVPR